MKIFYHPRFGGSYKRLSSVIQNKAERRELIFRKDPFDARLDAYKLHGKLRNQWSFSVDKKFRVLCEFDKSDIIFLDIGDHDLYK